MGSEDSLAEYLRKASRVVSSMNPGELDAKSLGKEGRNLPCFLFEVLRIWTDD